jgi:hypothetical protein
LSVILTGILTWQYNPLRNPRNPQNVPPADSLANVAVQSDITHKNLVIYFLTADHKLDQVGYVTLSEALEKKYATIIETGEVNQLSVSNNSKYFIFINAGDIVKGGRQDRTIGVDIIIPPMEKNVELVSFCVESSRWTQRGKESAAEFSSNADMLPSRNLKIAAQKDRNQSAVWENVSDQQTTLNTNVSNLKGSVVNVRSEESSSSLQLTLENKDLDSLRKAYREKFESVPKNLPNVVGFAYAINGELYGADLYNSRELFLKMWPKLLNSVVVEAITDFKSDTIKYTKPENVISTLNQVFSGKKNTQEINKITSSISYETDKSVVFEAFDLNHKDWLHKCFIVKDPNVKSEYQIDFNRNIRNNINQAPVRNNINEPDINNSDEPQENQINQAPQK